MNLTLQSLLKLSKILSEHNESEFRVERKLVEKNYTENKTGSYVVQLGSSTLSISKTNNFPCSEGEAEEFFNQLNELERQKKLYYQILEKKEPLASSEIGILVRGGGLGKSGPGPRAKAAARRNVKNSGSFLIPGANGFVQQRTYCRYHENAPLSCKPRVKVSNSPFQGDGNNPPPEDGSEFDFSQYKGGSSPFKNFDYDNENHTRENVAFSNQRRMNHSYDGHAEKCFGMQENRNKQSLQNLKKKIRDYVESAETERIYGSYRYETPAYHYKKPDEDLIVTVNATNNEYISVRNATDFQSEKLEIDGNLGYDSRPSMSLKLRDPKQ